MKKENKNLKIAVIAVFLFLLAASAAQAVVLKTNNVAPDKNLQVLDETHEWIDDFDNSQKIDMEKSENYVLKNGKVEIVDTEPMWTDGSFKRMKVVSLTSSVSDTDCAIKLEVDYDSDMRSDYGDLRFKFQDDDRWLDYWIEDKNPVPNDPYAIVWVKLGTLPQGSSKIYMFYGNPSATDQSDYWTVFDENSWSASHAHDHQVTYHWYKEGAWDPDVCYGNGKFLVTWEEGTAFWPAQGTIFQQQIRGQYFNTNGDPTSDRFDIVDEPDETPPYRYENPASAAGGGKFLVAYNKYINPLTGAVTDMDIEVALVSTASDGASTRKTLCNAEGIQADPSVAYGNGNYFVVWEDGREGTGNYDIYGRFVSPSGSLGAEKVISNRPNSQCEPWITYDSVNKHFMIVWEEGAHPENGPFDIWGQIFDSNGNPLGNAKRFSNQGSSSKDFNFPAVAFCSLTEKYLVTWNDGDISSNDWNGNVWGKILDENGNVVVDTFEIDHGSYCRTDVAPYLSTSWFVTYDSWTGSSGDIWGKMVNEDGSVNPYIIRLSDSDTEPCDWPNMATGGNKIFVAWEDLRVEYTYPFDDIMPDIYCNAWSLNTPSGSDVATSFGPEKSAVLEAYIVSVPISPTNLDTWIKFFATKSGSVSFDLLDGSNLNVLMSGVSSGKNIQSITKNSIRLRARFNRNNPSTTPSLDKWSVTYYGRDEDPPRTTIKTIDGVKGLNEYYISQGVTIWLQAQDLSLIHI